MDITPSDDEVCYRKRFVSSIEPRIICVQLQSVRKCLAFHRTIAYYGRPRGMRWMCVHAATLPAALQAMPCVRQLDLTDCTYFPTLLADLPKLCPQLESLRLGGFKLTLRRRHRLRTEQEAAKALLQSLPRISHAHVQECWEDEEQPEVRGTDVLYPCAAISQVKR